MLSCGAGVAVAQGGFHCCFAADYSHVITEKETDEKHDPQDKPVTE